MYKLIRNIVVKMCDTYLIGSDISISYKKYEAKSIIHFANEYECTISQASIHNSICVSLSHCPRGYNVNDITQRLGACPLVTEDVSEAMFFLGQVSSLE